MHYAHRLPLKPPVSVMPYSIPASHTTRDRVRSVYSLFMYGGNKREDECEQGTPHPPMIHFHLPAQLFHDLDNVLVHHQTINENAVANKTQFATAWV